ncbi:hypothetical protein Q8A73_021863 [Channa argus]|nr:hypothetical protein Q8A73_021863 [Channa argus]
MSVAVRVRLVPGSSHLSHHHTPPHPTHRPAPPPTQPPSPRVKRGETCSVVPTPGTLRALRRRRRISVSHPHSDLGRCNASPLFSYGGGRKWANLVDVLHRGAFKPTSVPQGGTLDPHN